MDDLNTVTKVFSAVLAALFGAITWIGKAIWRKTDETEKRLVERWEKCEAKHAQANEKVTELSAEVGELKGQVVGVQSMAALHTEVLREVSNCPAKRDQVNA